MNLKEFDKVSKLSHEFLQMASYPLGGVFHAGIIVPSSYVKGDRISGITHLIEPSNEGEELGDEGRCDPRGNRIYNNPLARKLTDNSYIAHGVNALVKIVGMHDQRIDAIIGAPGVEDMMYSFKGRIIADVGRNPKCNVPLGDRPVVYLDVWSQTIENRVNIVHIQPTYDSSLRR